MKRMKESLKLVWEISKIDFLIMVISLVFRLLINILYVYQVGKLFGEIGNLKVGQSLDLKQILFFGMILLLSRFQNIFYERFFSTFVSMPRLELKLKQLMHDKVSKIHSRENCDAKTNVYVNRAVFAGTNIFRLVQIYTQLVMSVISFATIFALMSTMNIYLSIGLVVAIVPKIIVEMRETKIKVQNRDKRVELRRMEKLYRETITGDPQYIETKINGADEFFKQRYVDTRNDMDAVATDESAFIKNTGLIFSPLLIYSDISGILTGVLLLYYDIISFSVFGSAVSAFTKLKEDITSILSLVEYGRRFGIMVEPYFDFLAKIEREGEETTDGKTLELKDVYFKYPNAKDFAISGINLKINPGEKVAIVGINGSGKSTLSKLLLGEFEPTKGEVLIGGVSSKKLKEPEIYDKRSQVSQFFNRYEMSLKENISFDKDLIFSESDVKSFVKKKELDLESVLGREFGGMELSGGEWQRIAILRGFNKNSEFITLDEPTSAIDPINEKEIYDFFDDNSNGKTEIIITHRLGAIKYVDRILVMENGKIIEDGDFRELTERQGKFKEIYDSQSELFLSKKLLKKS